MSQNHNLEPILDIRNLSTSFYTTQGEVKAVDQVSLSLMKGQTLGLVGESGCGKSVTSLSILRLIEGAQGRIKSGEVFFSGRDLLKLSEREMRKIRGNEISIIFQESMSSLNPVFTIGNQICEAIALHQDFSKAEVRNRALELLKSVGLPSPEKSIDDYPHQLSGGMRQRVMIAMAISCNPALLIADEPTTALDVTIQAQILDLLRKLQSENQMAMLLITHDLGVIAEMADQVAVMYAGQLVEVGAAQEIINHPKHPYTRGLLKSIPVKGMKRLEAIRGMVPDLTQLPSGCRFGDRCDWVVDACRSKIPELLPSNLGLKHQVRCIKDL